jgi:Family of unknown function (DUF5519)
MHTPSLREAVRRELLVRSLVTESPHRFGGIEFRLGRRELGHVHGDRLADIPFPKRMRDDLLKAGRVRPHHVLPQSGWASRTISTEDDADDVIALLRLNYDRAARRAGTRRGGSPVEAA